MFDLIITDVDGTLLDPRNHLPTAIISAVREAHQEGIPVTIASGRSKSSLAGILDALEVTTPHIGSCGAYLADLDGRILEHNPLSKAEGEIVVHAAYTEPDIWGVTFQNIDVLIGDPKGYWRMVQYIQENIVCVDDLLSKNVPAATKIDVMGESDRLVRIRQVIERQTMALTITSEKTHCMEVTAPGVSKGTGIQRLSELLNIPLSRIAVIGDGFNDISMFKVAGLSIAMGNAHPEVKQYADCIAPGNDQAGVAWAIEEIMRRNASLPEHLACD